METHKNINFARKIKQENECVNDIWEELGNHAMLSEPCFEEEKSYLLCFCISRVKQKIKKELDKQKNKLAKIICVNEGRSDMELK